MGAVVGALLNNGHRDGGNHEPHAGNCEDLHYLTDRLCWGPALYRAA
ncbi:hypothetical protein SAMN05421869_122128 [Nonomuraea jiangxiensis]|uniref:Uncharacterized protein n=1 Tax=Nonomuraea jiangxiensis TaxID=633440 RepID=A0A1G9HJJ6_9ACTN|nr:hypothetical protein SAMN05421869_122128 [Nonomuraea jiangxiensis]